MFAIAAEGVCEALPVARMSPVTMRARGGRTGVLALDEAGNGPGHVWVFDPSMLVSRTASARDADCNVIVVRRGMRAVGLVVGGLHGVTKFDRADDRTLVKQIIKANGGDCLIQAIDIDRVFAMLERPQAA